MISSCTATSAPIDPLLQRILEEAIDRLQGGEALDSAALLAAHPRFATQLQELLPTVARLARLGEPCYEQPQDGPNAFTLKPSLRQLGDFRLEREIGRGGMGIVYQAEQVSTGRRVALKVLPAAASLRKQSLQRFQNEARAAASLDHPNIVAVYVVGHEQGVHYYAMQLVRGRTVAELIERLQREQPDGDAEQPLTIDAQPAPGKSMTTPIDSRSAGTEPHEAWEAGIGSGIYSGHGPEYFRTAAELARQAAEALQYAHERGVLHRDIKPSNMMLDERGRLYVVDFGLARIEADPGLTATGSLLGTLRYMAPEQALAKRVVVDQRADVYALGATLYELLALRPAFAETDRSELLKQIAFEDPAPLCSIARGVPVDLEAIVAKAMAKEPGERYQTAQCLADDLQAFLDSRPITARPPSWRDRLVKWSRRHQAAAWAALAAIGATAIVLAISVALVSRAYWNEHRALGQVAVERDAAQGARDEARRQRDAGYERLYVAQMRLAHQLWQRGDVALMQRLLDEHLPRAGRADLRGWEWYYLQSLPLAARLTFVGHDDRHDAAGATVAWRPDGRVVASAPCGVKGGVSEIKLWDPRTGDVLQTLRDSQPIASMTWSPDGERLAIAQETYGDGLAWHLVIWHVRSAKKHLTITTGGPDPFTASWSPDGRRIASPGAGHAVVVWDASTGKELQRLTGYGYDVKDVAWSPDGRRLAASGFDLGKLVIWNVESASIDRTIYSGDREMLTAPAWNSDSSRIAAAAGRGRVKAWNAASGKTELVLDHRCLLNAVAFSPDGRRLATMDRANRITLWDASRGTVEQTLQGHAATLSSMAWSPDGGQIVSAAHDELAMIWDVGNAAPVATADQETTAFPTWSPDGRFLAFQADAKSATIWDVAAGRALHHLEGSRRLCWEGLSWSPDGAYLACPSDDGTIWLWEASSGRLVHTWAHDRAAPADDYKMTAIAWRPRGCQLASITDADHTVRVWDARTAKLVDSFPFEHDSRGYDLGIAFSPDGRQVAVSSFNEGTRIWNCNGWTQVAAAPTQRTQLPSWALAWSPDSRHLAATSGRHTYAPFWVIDGATGHARVCAHGRPGRDIRATWSPDGRRVITCGADGTHVWNPFTGDELLALDERQSGLSPDGKRLAILLHDAPHIHDLSKGFHAVEDSAFRRRRGEAYSLQAMEELNSGQSAAAKSYIELALVLAPNNPLVQLRTAWFLAFCDDPASRDPARARLLESRALAAFPAAQRRQAYLGIRLADLDRDPWAVEKLNMALRILPSSARTQTIAAHYFTMAADEKKRDYDRALKLARTAAAALPDSAIAWQALGWSLYRTGDWQASIHALEKSMALQGDGGDYAQCFVVAMANAQLGRATAARHWLDKAIRQIEGREPPPEFAQLRAEAEAVVNRRSLADGS
ncbi:MAG: hypothetical protein DCC67_02340 [Planctomycetota bacterium]|nr:MAG: hypothetical protein DCC67_02340 [Planctomycetota bacterium]